jgi:hypothetical protein
MMNTQLVQSLAQVIRSLSPDEQEFLLQQLVIPQVEALPTVGLSQRQSFLQLPLEERRRIFAEQAEALLTHYQEDPEWRDVMAGD